jgi:hypothetical protein
MVQVKPAAARGPAARSLRGHWFCRRQNTPREDILTCARRARARGPRRITSAPDVRCGSESPLLFLVFGIVVLTSWCLPLPLVETFADGDMLASCGGRERNEFDFYSARSLTRLQAPPVSRFYSLLLHVLHHMRALCVLPRPTTTSTRSELRPPDRATRPVLILEFDLLLCINSGGSHMTRAITAKTTATRGPGARFWLSCRFKASDSEQI